MDKQSRNSRILGKFFKTFFIAMGIFAAAFAMVVVGFSMFDSSDTVVENADGTTEIVSGKKNSSLFNIFGSKEEQRDNFLILGVDEDGTRTDVMMIGTFNHSTVQVDLISLPRDIKVTMPQDRYDVLIAEGKNMNSDRTMKLNEVHHHAGGGSRGIEYLTLQIEELLDIDLDFYVKIDTEAFRYIVDEIGGVEFDVPQRMYYYDPTQNLKIDLQPGLQTLYGKDAEGLVRFRSYPQADLMRVQVQQEFIKALVKQCLARENIINNAQAMVMTTLKYVETDFGVTKIPGYIKYLNSFSADNLNTYTMPTMADNSSSSSKSYILLDEVNAKELVDVVFKGIEPEASQPAFDKNIQVLNGGYESGLAKRGKDILEENGYSVISITDYSGSKESYTRIMVNKMGLGEDIQALFPGSKIVYDPSMSTELDIIVVIGTDGV